MKRLIPLVLCLMLAFSAVASAEVLIGVSFDDLNTEFWQANIGGIRKEAEARGVKLIEVVANGDANKQNEQISDLLARGAQAIICAAADGSSIQSAIEEAKSMNVPFIMDNRPVQGDTLPDLQILSDNESMAYAEMNWLIDYAKRNNITFKNAIMLIGDLGDENALQRKNGYMRSIEENPGIVNVAVEIPTEWKHEVALAGLQNALQANPDADLIILPSDYLWTPVQSALEQVGKWAKRGEANHVACISFDGDVNGMQMLKDGYNWANAAQAAVKTGELSVSYALDLIEGKTFDEVNQIDPGIIANFENLEEVKDGIWGWAGVK